jgi:peptidoglycan/LPS O-acetylase OafA/YrhL
MSSLKYRPDIDGLRALAVLGVVIYHAFPWMIPGGFIGVDIFFVISGYLISGILYKGHSEGNFSFREFYARRIKRLFPALITMLVITLAYGWMILLPDEFAQLGKHVAAGTLFIQNFVFWQESGYFDTAASLKPLLHLWSLAVEEQFYIIFPLLLLLVWKKPKFLIPSMGILLISTFILNVVMSAQNSASDFFLTPYRTWEFLGGSLLAWWHYDRGHEEDVPSYRETLSWVGIILLGLGIAFIHTVDPYPGWRAILPVTGTLLLMEGGSTAWVNRTILSNRSVVWIGLISYPLYLFHWPALSFVHIVKGPNPKAYEIFAALGVSLILTLLTYYFIEKRIRHHKSIYIVPGLVLAFIMTGVLGGLMASRVITSKNHEAELSDILAASDEAYMSKSMKALYPSEHVALYETGAGTHATLFVGDSNIEQYIPRIKSLLEKPAGNPRRAIFLTSGGVPPIPDIREKVHPGALELLSQMELLLKKDPGIDRVVLGANWVWYCSLPVYPYEIHGERFPSEKAKKEAFDVLRALMTGLLRKGISVYLVMNTPVSPVQDPKSDITRGFNGILITKVDPLTVQEFDDLYGKFLSGLKSCAEESGAIVIDPRDFFKKNGVYPRVANGKHLYKDSCHLRSSYVRDHVTYLDKTVDR